MAFSALPAWLADLFVLATGACIGSFLNVVVQRLPQDESIVSPGSHCACGQPIAWRDMIPILAWFLLRGKARCCGARISARYPLIEALAAGLFLASWLLLPPLPAVSGWVYLSILIAATFIDFDLLIIPDGLTIGGAGIGVILSLLVPALHGQHNGYFALDALRSGGAAVLGVLIGSGLLFWVATLAEAALKKESMGFGDVKLAGAIGAFCGWHGAVFALFGGAIIGTFGLAAVLIVRGLRRPKEGPALQLGSPIPFGPMLAAAGALYFLVLHGPVDRWFAQVAQLF